MSTKVDVRDIVEHPGASRTLHLHEPVAGLSTELAAVPEDRPVGADLLLESVVEGILVSGPVTGRMALTCARCLRAFEADFSLDVQELYAPGAGVQDDEYPLVEGFVDLEPMIRDAVILAMPFAPLCQPDCRGLCERCGGNRNLGECTCPPQVDARWAPLRGLTFDEDRGAE